MPLHVCRLTMLALPLTAVSIAWPSAKPSLDQVMERVAAHVDVQIAALSNVVADERCVQRNQYVDGGVFEERTLESEIAFVRLRDPDDTLGFRNVMRVDGEPTGADPGLLEKLVRDGPTATQAQRIAAESSKYNLGRLQRNFNQPTLVYHFMLRRNQERFRFTRAGETQAGGEGVWIVEYRERQRPTIIRFEARRDVPVNGRLWIAPADGKIVRATIIGALPVASSLEFTWREEPKLGIWVPAEMRETYWNVPVANAPPGRRARRYDITGVATYSNYRRFETEFRIK
jgi:hypothetical protein